MDSLSLHRGGWRDARVVLQALFAELAVYLNRAGGWAAQAPTTDLRTPPPTSRSPTRTKQPICRCNNIPRHFLRPTMIEFALLFTCFRKLGPGFRKPSAGPVVMRCREQQAEVRASFVVGIPSDRSVCIKQVLIEGEAVGGFTPAGKPPPQLLCRSGIRSYGLVCCA